MEPDQGIVVFVVLAVLCGAAAEVALPLGYFSYMLYVLAVLLAGRMKGTFAVGSMLTVTAIGIALTLSGVIWPGAGRIVPVQVALVNRLGACLIMLVIALANLEYIIEEEEGGKQRHLRLALSDNLMRFHSAEFVRGLKMVAPEGLYIFAIAMLGAVPPLVLMVQDTLSEALWFVLETPLTLIVGVVIIISVSLILRLVYSVGQALKRRRRLGYDLLAIGGWLIQATVYYGATGVFFVLLANMMRVAGSAEVPVMIKVFGAMLIIFYETYQFLAYRFKDDTERTSWMKRVRQSSKVARLFLRGDLEKVEEAFTDDGGDGAP